MKVVINKCFGGFGLSNKALKKLAKLQQGIDLYFYKQTKYDFNDGINEYTKINENDKESFTHPMTKNLGNVVNELPEDFYFSRWDLERDRSNSLLIQVVEELGDEANGDYAKLKIVEIPDGTEYEIDEYDGMESIEEKHRSWS